MVLAASSQTPSRRALLSIVVIAAVVGAVALLLLRRDGLEARFRDRPELPRCGTSRIGLLAEHASDRVAEACLADAVLSGRPAELYRIFLSPEGHETESWLRSLGSFRVEIYTNSVGDRFGANKWSILECKVSKSAVVARRYCGT